jgi:hypothetical protein
MSWEENSKGVISDRLRALLIFSKRPDAKEWKWQVVADALAEIYSPGMRLYWVMHHLVEAYQEATAEPRFEVGRCDVLEVLMAPIKGHTAIDMLGPASLETKYTVEDFYNAMVVKILGQLQCTNIAWLREAQPQS